ncbi:MAG: hypothetical protein ABIG46_01895, partial [Candidatus Omnitrophota bacterium]
ILLEKKQAYDILKISLENVVNLYQKAKDQLESNNFSIVSISLIDSTDSESTPVVKIKPTELLIVIFVAVGLAIGILMALFIERSSIQHRIPSGRDG